MYDPLEITPQIESQIIKRGIHKKYYRIRGAKYYGGISTADVVGCNMYCHFCWVHPKIRFNLQMVGQYYTPEEIGNQLIQIAQKAHFTQLRISGGEPTLGEAHLIALLKYLSDFPFHFILETNGMLLSQENYVQKLKKFNNLYVRISIKACTPEMFSKVTGATPEAYFYPLHALEFLIANEIACHPSIIIDFCSQREFQFLTKQLNQINPELQNKLEYESLILYPHVKKGLKKIGLIKD
jgi:uncharacterized Fe-S cluster-containing radical SAM superfamily protein